MSDAAETAMPGGWQTEVHRRDDVVLRSAKPQSSTVIALLRHLHEVGFAGSPIPVGHGFAADGREQLSYIEGESPHPRAWTDEAAWHVGRLVRELHDATASFAVPNDALWRPWFARSLGGSFPVIGHGDLGPWNVVARDGLPVGFIDWDYAGPTDGIWELAQVAWLNGQLHDDDVAALNDLPAPGSRARQMALIVDGYGLPRTQRVGFVDKMIEMAVRSAREEAVEGRVGPDSSSPPANGFPVMWAITWRTRAAAWMLDHREVLETALIRQ